MTAVQGQVSSVFKRAKFTKFTPSAGEHESEKDQRQNKRDQRNYLKHQRKFSLSLGVIGPQILQIMVGVLLEFGVEAPLCGFQIFF